MALPGTHRARIDSCSSGTSFDCLCPSLWRCVWHVRVVVSVPPYGVACGVRVWLSRSLPVALRVACACGCLCPSLWRCVWRARVIVSVPLCGGVCGVHVWLWLSLSLPVALCVPYACVCVCVCNA